MTKVKMTKEYKFSGIDWLGDVPIEWDFLPVRAVLKERKEKNTKLEESNILSVMKGVGVIRYEDKGNVGNKSSERPGAYKIVRKNDLVLNNMNLSIGSVGMAHENGVTSSVYIIYQARPGIAVPGFYSYLFQTISFQRHLASYGRGIMELREAVKERDIKNQFVIVPPLVTQKRIADFLDEKTKIIDELVAKKERLIKLLREKRAALIIHTVTKGLNPNAKLKPSGIDWLGDIPVGWNVKRFKFIARLQYGDSLAAENRETGDVPVYGSNGQVGTHSKANTKTPAIIVGRKGSFGAVNYVEEPVFAIDTTFLIDARWSNENLKWLNYCMSIANLNDISLDTGVPGLSREIAHNKVFPLPQQMEQKQISDYLDAETAKIDKAVVLIKSQIDKLKEYRSSLIYHAVTGKIKA